MFPFRSVAVTRHGQRRRRCRWATRYRSVRKRSRGKNGANGLRTCSPNLGTKPTAGFLPESVKTSRWLSPLASLIQPAEKPCSRRAFPAPAVAHAVFLCVVPVDAAQGRFRRQKNAGRQRKWGTASRDNGCQYDRAGKLPGTAKKDRDGAEPSRRTEVTVTPLPAPRRRAWRRHRRW